MSTVLGETAPDKGSEPSLNQAPRKRHFITARGTRNILFFFCCLVTFAIIYFPYDIFGNTLKTQLKSAAKAANILLDMQALTLAFPGVVTMSQIEANILRPGLVPLPFSVKQATIKPRYSAMLSFSAAVDAFISAYDGEFTLRATRGLFSDDIELSASGSKINLEQHPVLQVYQVSGILDFVFSGRLTGSSNATPVISQGSLQLDLSGGRFIPSKVGGTVSILPDFADTNVHFAMAGTDRGFRATECHLTSSLGAATCQGRIELNSVGGLGFVSLTATITLNDEGAARLGTLLALASNDASSNEKRRWKLSFSQTATNKGKFLAEAL